MKTVIESIQFYTTQKRGCVGTRICFTCKQRVDGTCLCIMTVCPLCRKCHKDFHSKYGYKNNIESQFKEWKLCRKLD